MSTATYNNIQAALDAGKKIGTFEGLGTVINTEGTPPLLIVPAGFAYSSLEPHLPAPLATRTAVALNDAVSFVDYVNRFKNADTLVFADLDNRKFESVIDYHGAAAPKWGKHRATFACAVTPAWKEWTDAANDRKPKSQVEFARFIEEHVPHIASPDGATLLELCLTLEAKKDVKFRASTRLADGQHQFRYEEEIKGSAGAQNGQFDVPPGFIVVIEPILGVGLKQIEARFRYRIAEGHLSMWYELVRPSDVLDAAFQELTARMKLGLGETPVLAGIAPQQQK